MRLKEIPEKARRGDLLLIEGSENSILLCEYLNLKLHHPKWNNLYERDLGSGRDIGFLWIIGNALEITPNGQYRIYDKGNFLSFPRGITDKEAMVENFELGLPSTTKRLEELGFKLYAEGIKNGGLITSEEIKNCKRNILNFWKRNPFSLDFDVVRMPHSMKYRNN